MRLKYMFFFKFIWKLLLQDQDLFKLFYLSGNFCYEWGFTYHSGLVIYLSSRSQIPWQV